MSLNGRSEKLPNGVKIKIEPDQSYDPEDFPDVEATVFVAGPVKQEPCDPDDYPRSAGVKRKASSPVATSSPAQWNHNTEDMSRILNNIKTEPGLVASNPAPKKARVDHNRNYERQATSDSDGVQVITGNRRFLNEVYLGRFPHPVNPWEVSHFVRNYLGFNVWPRDVICPGDTYAFVMMRNSREAHAICSGGPIFYRSPYHPRGGKLIRANMSDRAKAARGLRDSKSIRWFHGK